MKCLTARIHPLYLRLGSSILHCRLLASPFTQASHTNVTRFLPTTPTAAAATTTQPEEDPVLPSCHVLLKELAATSTTPPPLPPMAMSRQPNYYGNPSQEFSHSNEDYEDDEEEPVKPGSSGVYDIQGSYSIVSNGTGPVGQQAKLLVNHKLTTESAIMGTGGAMSSAVATPTTVQSHVRFPPGAHDVTTYDKGILTCGA